MRWTSHVRDSRPVRFPFDATSRKNFSFSIVGEPDLFVFQQQNDGGFICLLSYSGRKGIRNESERRSCQGRCGLWKWYIAPSLPFRVNQRYRRYDRLIAITRLEKYDSKSVRSSENDSNMRHELSAIAHSTAGLQDRCATTVHHRALQNEYGYLFVCIVFSLKVVIK